MAEKRREASTNDGLGDVRGYRKGHRSNDLGWKCFNGIPGGLAETRRYHLACNGVDKPVAAKRSVRTQTFGCPFRKLGDDV